MAREVAELDIDLDSKRVLDKRSPAFKADWATSVERFYAVDYDAGNDNNDGFSDVSGADAGTKALKTLEELALRLPPNLAGRMITILIKPRAGGATYKKKDGTTDDNLDLSGTGGTAYAVIRATTDFSNDATDQVVCGAMIAVAGPGASSEWTVAGGATTSSMSVASGSLPTETNGVSNATMRRGRFLTGALAGTCFAIHSNNATDIVPANNFGSAPSAGDTFVIEQPALRVARVRGMSSSPTGHFPGGNSGRVEWVGIAATASETGAFSVGTSKINIENVVFCECNASTNNATFNATVPAGTVTVGGSYFPISPGLVRTCGVGLRTVGSYSFLRLSFFSFTLSGFLNTSSTGSLGSIATINCGSGSVVARGIILNNCSYGARFAPLGIGGSLGLGATSAANSRRMRVTAPSGQVTINECGALCVKGLHFENGTSASLVINSAGGSFTIDDCTSSGCTDVFLDVQNAVNCKLTLGLTTANTATGTLGDIRLAGGAITTHAGLATTNIVDKRGNNVAGSGGHVVSECIEVTNSSGGALAIGDLVKSNGISGQVTKAQSNSEANARAEGVMVTPPANSAVGYMAPTGPAWVQFIAGPTAGNIAYISDTAGQARDTAQDWSSANIYQRLGRVLKVSGTLGLLDFRPDISPSNTEFVSADPRISGLDRPVGFRAFTSTRAYDKVGTGTRDWVDLGASVYHEASGTVSQVDLSGLTGDIDKNIRFGGFIINASGGDIDVRLRPNAETTNLSGTFAGVVEATSVRVASGRGSEICYFEGWIEAVAGATRHGFFWSAGYSGSAPLWAIGTMKWTTTTGEITSLRFIPDQASSIAAGSKFWAYTVPQKLRT